MQFLNELCGWLEATRLAVWIGESRWAFPTVESLHVVAITLVLGLIAVADLRLLGLAWNNRPVTEVLDDMLPVTWVAFAMALLCGSLLFISQAAKYVANGAFQAQMFLMLLAGVKTLALQPPPSRS